MDRGLKWHPVITNGITQPAIESDCRTWRISKALVESGYRYALHKHAGEASHYADDAEKLKRMASESSRSI